METKRIPGAGTPAEQREAADRLLRTQRDLLLAVSAVHDLQTTLRLCLEAALEATGMECGGLYLTDGEGGLQLAPSIGLSEDFVAAVSRLPAERPNTRMVMTGEPAYLRREQLDAIPAAAERREGLRALGVIPIRHGGSIIGSLNVASRRIDEVPPLARPALEAIGSAASMLIARAQADDALKTSARDLQVLSRQLLAVQEAERRRLARELHDGVGQQLAGLAARLEAARRSQGPDLPAAVDAALAICAETIDMIGDLSRELRPAILDDYGLAAALRWHAERVASRTGVRVDLGLAGLEGRLGPEVETAAFRIVQEALTNVVRHAGTDVAQVRLWLDGGRLRVQVEDEGQGFDRRLSGSGTRGFGLSSMRERAELLGGSLQVESEPGMGTRLLAELPVPVASRREPGE